MIKPTKLEVGDEVKGSDRIDHSDIRFKGVKGKVVKIDDYMIFVDFPGDLIPYRMMYRHELIKITSK